MKLYRLGRALSIVELVECDEDRAVGELKCAYEAGLTTYDSGEEALEKTGFGLFRSEADFLEASCNGLDSISFHSDRLIFPSKITSIFSMKQRFSIPADRVKGEQVIRDYFRMPRETFEATYQAYVTR